MKRSVFALVILASIFLAGCPKVCENIKVGDAKYSAEALGYFNYTNGDEVTFVSESGKEIVFDVNIQEELYHICQKITCDPLDPYKSSFCEYIESPQNSVFLNSDSTLIGFTIGIQAYEPETDLLYEFVKFTISHINDSAVASYISDVRFTSPIFDKKTIIDIEEFVIERSTITLNNNVYEDVLVCEDEKLALFYQKANGIVGLTINGETFTVK